jgi:hypothetical protein
LTTVALDADAAARAVGDLFSKDRAPPGRLLIPTKLVLRQSA